MKPKTRTECKACEFYRKAWLETSDELATAKLALKSAESQLQLWLDLARDCELHRSAKLTLDSLKNRAQNNNRGRDA
jgi:hypothetical protein